MKKEGKTVKKKSSRKTKIAGNEIFNDIHPNKKKHMSFGLRVGFLSFFFACFLFASVFLIITALTFEKAVYINYSERGVLDYKINLKPNKYYDTDVLTKGMNVTTYIASLIDSIDAIYNYNFNIDDDVNMDFSYDVIAKLRITDETEENLFLEKEYPLLKDKSVRIDNSRNATISETVRIDYDYYNAIATGFKSTYGVNSKSNLVILLMIHKSNEDATTTILNGSSVQQLKIPLSERAINIKLDYTNIDNQSLVVKEEGMTINNNIKLGAGCLSLLISILIALKIVKWFEKLTVKPNSFDKFVNKILKTYDRLIVESRNAINFDDYQIIKVDRFEELLDVRDNLKLPINYYIVTPHQKAIFYIVSTNVYTYTVKEVDLSNKQ